MRTYYKSEGWTRSRVWQEVKAGADHIEEIEGGWLTVQKIRTSEEEFNHE